MNAALCLRLRALLLVDGHHLLYRAHFGFPKRIHALDGTDVTGAFRFVALPRKAHRQHGPDVLATIATRTAADGRAVVVLSGDRDLYSLLAADGIRILNPQALPGRQFITARTVSDRYGVTPAQWADFRALTGDRSDDLAGVAGVVPELTPPAVLMKAAGLW